MVERVTPELIPTKKPRDEALSAAIPGYPPFALNPLGPYLSA